MHCEGFTAAAVEAGPVLKASESAQSHPGLLDGRQHMNGSVKVEIKTEFGG